MPLSCVTGEGFFKPLLNIENFIVKSNNDPYVKAAIRLSGNQSAGATIRGDSPERNDSIEG